MLSAERSPAPSAPARDLSVTLTGKLNERETKEEIYQNGLLE
jgi:hypothetical protein